MTNDLANQLAVGRRYRFTLRTGTFTGSLEGVVRSTSLPAGVLGNRDGEHSIWVEGELLEWFLRPGEIANYEALADDVAEASVRTSLAPARSARPGAPYKGRCVRRSRAADQGGQVESYPLLQYLVARHRRETR